MTHPKWIELKLINHLRKKKSLEISHQRRKPHDCFSCLATQLQTQIPHPQNKQRDSQNPESKKKKKRTSFSECPKPRNKILRTKHEKPIHSNKSKRKKKNKKKEPTHCSFLRNRYLPHQNFVGFVFVHSQKKKKNKETLLIWWWCYEATNSIWIYICIYIYTYIYIYIIFLHFNKLYYLFSIFKFLLLFS